MKISIIVPAYNIENYIDKCIRSISNQSFRNIEIIIVDDGSTDNTGKKCDSLGDEDKRVKVIHTVNNGLSVARNIGIIQSTGDYIMLVDGDDFIEIDCIAEIVKVIQKNQDVELIFGKMIRYYEDGTCLPEEFLLDEEFPKHAVGKDVLLYLFNHIPVVMWNAWRTIYKRSVFDNSHNHFYPGITSEDLQVIPKIYISAKNVSFYNNPFYYYRQQRPDSIMSTVNHKRFLDIVFIIEEYISYFHKFETDKILEKEFLKQLAKLYRGYLVSLPLVDKMNKDYVIQKMKSIKLILKYDNSMTSIIAYGLISILGLSLTSKLLYMVRKTRKLRNSLASSN